MSVRNILIAIALVIWGNPAFAAPPTKPTPEALEFFEKRVRPLLLEKCVGCHGAKAQQGGIRLDTRLALLESTNRRVVVPGDPDKSLLLHVVRYDGKIKMPPAGKLRPEEIEALTAWVKMGAPWTPETAPKPKRPDPRKLWALRPVVRPAVPKVKNASLAKNPIDAFLLASLEKRGLAFSRPTDKRTLLRRISYDLTGLPPTASEMQTFLADPAPDAYAKAVDRLLTSPAYGERWGRYWLDVARYADNKGYVYTEEKRYPFSYTYRDWVVRALNEDMPYNQFLRYQLAADLLPLTDKRHLAAMGFITLGRRFVNNPPDVIDDRLDVVFRGTQGLTLACARCHDHKFDPLPTKDYYALYGVFSGSSERTVQIDDNPQKTPEYEKYLKEREKREKDLHNTIEAKRAELSDRLRKQVAAYLPQVPDVESLPGNDFYIILSPEDVNPFLVRKWKAYIDAQNRTFSPIFAPWGAFTALSESEWAQRAPALAQRFAQNAEGKLNPKVAQLFAGTPPKNLREVAERYGKLLAEVDAKWRDHLAEAKKKGDPLPTALPKSEEEALRQTLYAPDSPTSVPGVRIHEIETLFDEGTRNELNALQAKIDQWCIESLATPPHALILSEMPPQRNPRVFRRGDPRRLGDEVPRHFLTALSGANSRPFRNGNGRLELADAIANPKNPLTARVMVNRVWSHHFGAGLVRTPSDFGTRSEPPTHPELLDWLASVFMQEGWSLKRLHRRILLSNAYRQRADDNPLSRRLDSENRLLWRMNRQRLDFEAMHDSLLAVAGELDTALGGRPIDLTATPSLKRRAIYGYIDRQNLPNLLRTFDFANPDTHSPQRFVTTVPQQALFLLNSPFMAERAKALVQRATLPEGTPATVIQRLYLAIFQREPTARERELGEKFLTLSDKAEAAESVTTAPLSVWERYAQALLLANEFLFID